jgi:hypothetical protein
MLERREWAGNGGVWWGSHFFIIIILYGINLVVKFRSYVKNENENGILQVFLALASLVCK